MKLEPNNDEGVHASGKEKEKMVNRSVSVPLSLWNEARKKAGLGSLSAVIQKFLRLWVAGKINLDDYEED